MRRLDRAMYGIFLLVLLADVARVHASVPADATGGLILRAASRLSDLPEASPDRRASQRNSARIANLKRISLRLSGWTKALASQSAQPNHASPALLSAAALLNGAPGNSPHGSAFLSASSSLAIFEHSGSPAP